MKHEDLCSTLVKGSCCVLTLANVDHIRKIIHCIDIIQKENELQSVFQFYKTNNNNLLNPLNSIQFIQHEGKYVGFFL